jgi:hypothetical protein
MTLFPFHRVALSKATGQANSRRNKELTKLYQHFSANSNDREEAVINWQTKIFSRAEFAKYTSPTFQPTTILDEHYREECAKLKERNHTPGRLFTYIDSDPYQFVDEIECEVGIAASSDIPPYLQKPKSNLKKRRPLIGMIERLALLN